MIGKISKSTNFSPPLTYLENKLKEGKGSLIDTNMYGKDVKALITEFETVSSMRRIRDPVFHASINLAPGESLSDGQFKQVALDYLDSMGFKHGLNQYRIYRHWDKADREHVHILANRILLNNSVVEQYGDYRKSETCMRTYEKQFGLSTVIESKEAKTKQLSKGQIELYKKTGKPPLKLQLALILDETLKEKPSSLTQFIQKMHENGVSIRFHFSKDKVFGISYEMEKVRFKGSQIGRGYTWSKIQKQLNYEHKRDFKSISESRNRGEKNNPSGTGQQVTGVEYLRYQSTKKGFISDNRVNEGINHSSSGGRSEIESYPSKAESVHHQIRAITQTESESFATNLIKGIPDSNPIGNAQLSGNVGSESVNKIKKKRPKRRIKL